MKTIAGLIAAFVVLWLTLRLRPAAISRVRTWRTGRAVVGSVGRLRFGIQIRIALQV